MSNNFPFVIDSSIMSAFRSCPRKCQLLYFQHWKSKNESVHLHAGAAYAHGLEAARRSFYQEGKSEQDSEAEGLKALMEAYGDFEPPVGSAKTLDRMMGAIQFYFEQYPMSTDHAVPADIGGEYKGIEVSFAYPLEIKHPENNDPILFCGRMDMLANYAGGLYVFDDKTTSSLGASWGKQWDLRSQFTAYCKGCSTFGLNPTGVLTRGVSILKTKYDTMQVLTYRAPWEIERWERQTERDILRMIGMWTQNEWDYNLDHSCTEYGGCMFMQICKHEHPEDWLPSYFEQRVWDPQERKNLTLEEYEKKWGFIPLD